MWIVTRSKNHADEAAPAAIVYMAFTAPAGAKFIRRLYARSYKNVIYQAAGPAPAVLGHDKALLKFPVINQIPATSIFARLSCNGTD